MKNNMYLNLTLTFLFACLMASTSFAQLTSNDGYVHLRNQSLYGDNNSALFWRGNHNTVTQLILEDKQGTRYGKVVGTGNGVYFGLMDGNNKWTFVSKKNDWTSLRVNNSEKMRILANGRVGIGTDDPQAKLHITSGMRTAKWDDATEYMNIYHSGFSKSGVNGIYFGINDQNVLTLAPNGNVGMGTNSPGNKLEVNGTIRSKEVKVELANWGDYVFYDDYELPTLGEEEAYIEANGHLSGFESAETMGDEIQLGDVSKRQQVKIEEIVLHLIELKKENDELKKEMEVLKAKVEK